MKDVSANSWGWTMPGADKFSVTRTFLSGFLPKRLFPLGTNQLCAAHAR